MSSGQSRTDHQIELLLDMIIGLNSGTKQSWKDNHNSALGGTPSELMKTLEGKIAVRDYLLSRTSFGR